MPPKQIFEEPCAFSAVRGMTIYMNYRTGSLITLGILLLLGVMFFVMSFDLPMTEPGMVIGSGYYPRVLSLLLICGSAAGLVTTFRDKKGKEVKVSIDRPLNFVLILALLTLVAFVWQRTREFYPITSLVVFILLFILNPEKISLKKVGKTLLLAAGLMGVIYATFTMALGIRL